MSLTPRSSLFDLDPLFENFWPSFRSSRDVQGSSVTPRVDIVELKDCYQIYADLPGVEKKDLNVTLDERMLTIEAKTQPPQSQVKGEGTLLRQERCHGTYRRSFNLGSDIKEGGVDANFNNGVLTLTAPKVEKTARVSHQIEIH